MTDFEDYVTVERVRVFLGYEHEKSVRRLVARGLPHRRVNGQLRFRLSEVDAWVDQQSMVGHGGNVIPLERRSA